MLFPSSCSFTSLHSSSRRALRADPTLLTNSPRGARPALRPQSSPSRALPSRGLLCKHHHFRTLRSLLHCWHERVQGPARSYQCAVLFRTVPAKKKPQQAPARVRQRRARAPQAPRARTRPARPAGAAPSQKGAAHATPSPGQKRAAPRRDTPQAPWRPRTT